MSSSIPAAKYPTWGPNMRPSNLASGQQTTSPMSPPTIPPRPNLPGSTSATNNNTSTNASNTAAKLRSSTSSPTSPSTPSIPSGRDRVARELLATERSYVSSLKVLVEVYETPIRSLARTLNLEENDLSKIFSTVEIILKVNTELLAMLEISTDIVKPENESNRNNNNNSNGIGGAAMAIASTVAVPRPRKIQQGLGGGSSDVAATPGKFSPAELIQKINERKSSKSSGGGAQQTHRMEPKSIGTIFLTLAPYLRMYTQYVNNFENANNHIQHLRKTNSKFDEFLKITETEALKKNLLVFSQYLIMPVQRIPRYNLLLRELLAETPESHSDYQNLKNALEATQATAEYVNGKMRESEARNMVFVLASSIRHFPKELKLIPPHRRFVKEDQLYICDGAASVSSPCGQQGTSASAAPCQMFLFSDLLIQCKIRTSLINKKHQSYYAQLYNRYKFKKYLWLNNSTEVRDIPDSGAKQLFGRPFCFEVISYADNTKETVLDAFFIAANNQEQKDTWVKLIGELCVQAVSSSNVNSTGSSNTLKPPRRSTKIEAATTKLLAVAPALAERKEPAVLPPSTERKEALPGFSEKVSASDILAAKNRLQRPSMVVHQPVTPAPAPPPPPPVPPARVVAPIAPVPAIALAATPVAATNNDHYNSNSNSSSSSSADTHLNHIPSSARGLPLPPPPPLPTAPPPVWKIASLSAPALVERREPVVLPPAPPPPVPPPPPPKHLKPVPPPPPPRPRDRAPFYAVTAANDTLNKSSSNHDNSNKYPPEPEGEDFDPLGIHAAAAAEAATPDPFALSKMSARTRAIVRKTLNASHAKRLIEFTDSDGSRETLPDQERAFIQAFMRNTSIGGSSSSSTSSDSNTPTSSSASSTSPRANRRSITASSASSTSSTATDYSSDEDDDDDDVDEDGDDGFEGEDELLSDDENEEIEIEIELARRRNKTAAFVLADPGSSPLGKSVPSSGMMPAAAIRHRTTFGSPANAKQQ